MPGSPLPTQIRMAMQHETDIEVRYAETDAQGVVHHANYFTYFELARVRFLAACGFDYAELEEQGAFLVVHSVSCRYIQPARFGDTLRLVTKVERVTSARIDHSYRILKGDELLAEGKSTIACINGQGQIQRIPEFLFDLKLPDQQDAE